MKIKTLILTSIIILFTKNHIEDENICNIFEKKITEKNLKLPHIINHKNTVYLLSEDKKLHQNGQSDSFFKMKKDCLNFFILKKSQKTKKYYKEKNCETNLDKFRIMVSKKKFLEELLKKRILIKNYNESNYIIILTENILKTKKSLEGYSKINFINKKIDCIQMFDNFLLTYDDYGNEFSSFEFGVVINFGLSKLYNFENYLKQISNNKSYLSITINNFITKLFILQKNNLQFTKIPVFVFKNEDVLLFDFEDYNEKYSVLRPNNIFKYFITKLLREKMKIDIYLDKTVKKFYEFLYHEFNFNKKSFFFYFESFENILFNIFKIENTEENIRNGFDEFIFFLDEFKNYDFDKKLKKNHKFVLSKNKAKRYEEKVGDSEETDVELELLRKLFWKGEKVFLVFVNLFLFYY